MLTLPRDLRARYVGGCPPGLPLGRSRITTGRLQRQLNSLSRCSGRPRVATDFDNPEPHLRASAANSFQRNHYLKLNRAKLKPEILVPCAPLCAIKLCPKLTNHFG